MEFLKRLSRTPRGRAVIAAVLAVVAGGSVAVTVAVTTDDSGRPKGTATVHVDGADPDRKRDETLTVPKAAIEQAKEDIEAHDELRDESPPGLPDERAERLEQLERTEARQDGFIPAGATNNQRGCKTAFVRNRSSRGGVRPDAIDLHYTVGSNRPGRSDVDGYTAMANNPGSGVSWHYVIDREGFCNYNVPESDKAWTQAGHNPYAIGIEIVNTGREGSLMDRAGYRKLAIVVRDAARRWNIPLRRSHHRGCGPGANGILQHKDLGLCGGGHVDITPYSIDQIVKIIRAGAPAASPLSKLERRIVLGTKSKRYRGHSRRYWCQRGRAQRAQIVRAARRPGPPRPGWGRFHRSARQRLLAKSIKESCS